MCLGGWTQLKYPSEEIVSPKIVFWRCTAMFSIFLGASASPLLMNQSHLFKEFTPCQWRKAFPLYNTCIFFLDWVYKRGSAWILFSLCCIFFLLIYSVILTDVMLLNSSYHLHWGERVLDFLILSNINQGVADMFSATVRVSLSLGDIIKLLLSNSGFMFLLPFSVFQWDTGGWDIIFF